MEYQKSNRYFVQVAGSLEKHAREELSELGATVLKEVPRGLYITCSPQCLYRVVYTSRLAQRVLAPLASFSCHSEKYLYAMASKLIDWTSLFSLDQSFGIDSNVSASKINHSLYAGQRLKDAICDQFRNQQGSRPDFQSSGADINFNLHIRENHAVISLDISGSMHRRGYRRASIAAPLQETLAAAIIRLSGWRGDKPLLDPMCGSGTLLAEALMSYCKVPAAYLRQDTAIRHLPDFSSSHWEQIKKEENSKIRVLPEGLISGSDLNEINLRTAAESLNNLPFGNLISLKRASFQSLEEHSGYTIITNPPYGVRLGSQLETQKLYQDLGDFLKRKCPQSEAYILCGSDKLVPELRLRAHWKKSLKNADLEVKLAKIVIR